MAAPSHLKALQALELAVRKGSLKEAAEMLAITPAAAGQRIKALEDYLGIDLLQRGRAGITAGPELAMALPHLHSAFAALEEATRELDLQRGHELHIAACSDFAELWLAPRLDRFRKLHPNIRFCINGEGDVPMRLGRTDCEIGFGPVSEDAFNDLLFRDFVLPITSPDNLERTAEWPAAVRLEGFPILHLDLYRNDPAGLCWPNWMAANGVSRTSPNGGMRFHRISNLLGAISANAGIGLCGLALILDRVKDGSIALPYPEATGIWSEHAFCARFRADSASKRHVERFRTWLQEESRLTSCWLEQAVLGPA